MLSAKRASGNAGASPSAVCMRMRCVSRAITAVGVATASCSVGSDGDRREGRRRGEVVVGRRRLGLAAGQALQPLEDAVDAAGVATECPGEGGDVGDRHLEGFGIVADHRLSILSQHVAGGLGHVLHRGRVGDEEGRLAIGRCRDGRVGGAAGQRHGGGAGEAGEDQADMGVGADRRVAVDGDGCQHLAGVGGNQRQAGHLADVESVEEHGRTRPTGRQSSRRTRRGRWCVRQGRRCSAASRRSRTRRRSPPARTGRSRRSAL